MAIQYSLTHRTNAMSQLNMDLAASAVIKIFSGSMPANCGTAASQVLTASAVANATAAATGTAGYFRIYPSAATTTNAVVQGTCGLSAADMILTNTSITSGQTVSFTNLTVTAFGV